MNRILALLPHKTGAFLLTIFCFTSIASAQAESCPALVQRALDTTDQSCAATQSNEACYGNVQIQVQAAPDAGAFDFSAPGDRVSLTQIQSLQLSSMVEPDEWGMALLRLQPRLANVLPGQNVTMLMFGNVKIDQRTHSQDNRGPMQAFFFRSGIGATLCDEVPRDGLLIQTPKGLGQLSFTINEVQIDIGSTVYLQANPGDAMIVAVFEGEVRVTAANTTVVVPAGAQASIPLDQNGAASGPPGVQGYAGTALSDNLPALQTVVDLMPEPVEIAADLATLRNGNWLWHSTVNTCGEPGFENTVALTVAEDGQSFLWGAIVYDQIEPGIYQNVYDRTTTSGDHEVGTATFYETTPTEMTFVHDVVLNGGSPCHIEADVTWSEDAPSE